MSSKNLLFKILISIMLLIVPLSVNAQRGCCSRYGGVAGCHSSGKQLCKDGTLSPSCTCTPKIKTVYGCTDPDAKNYNSKANKDNGSCKYYVYGCTEEEAKNYNPNAEKDDDSCQYYLYGCMDAKAINYDKLAEKDDGSCKYKSEEDTSLKVNLKNNVSSEESTDDDGDGVLSLLTLGGIGAGIYYMKKRK